MKLTFENIGTNTFLVYEINETDELDTMSLGMLTNNSIPGFAAASFTQMDTTRYIKYNVSSKVSVKQLFSGPVNKKRLLGVFSGVVDAMLSAEDYMLDPASIQLDTDYIFADVTTCETELICLPIMNLQQQGNQDLMMFFKNILFTTQFDQTENCDHVAQLINYFNNNAVLSLADFKAMLIGMTHPSAAAQPAYQQPAYSQPAAPVQPAPVAPQPAAQPAAPVQPVAPQPAAPVQPRSVAQPVPQPVPQPARPVAQPVPQPAPAKPVAKKPVPQPVIPGAPTPAPAQASSDEKPMSLMYLMQHYTKENAAIYKAQQEAAKAKKGAAAKPAAPAAKGRPGPGVAGPGVAIPGQPTPPPMPARPVAQPVPQPVRTPPMPQPARPVAQPVPQPVQPQPVAQPVYQPAPQPVQQPVYQAPAPATMPLNFGETTVLGGKIGETTVLGAAAEPNRTDPHLIRTKNNEKIPLNKPVFRIGKERSYVDYFISDNTAISRSHANIINHNGEFFVVDTNSTNHTYVNGGMIHSNEEVKLSHGTKIRLANEDFEFRLY